MFARIAPCSTRIVISFFRCWRVVVFAIRADYCLIVTVVESVPYGNAFRC